MAGIARLPGGGPAVPAAHHRGWTGTEDETCAITDFAVAEGAIAHYVFFLIPVGRGKYINDTALKVAANERLLRQIMAKQAEVDIDVKPTCAPQFTRVAKQLGVETRFDRGCLAGLTVLRHQPLKAWCAPAPT